MKCLIVDDNELDRELIALYLSGIADCEMAGNGSDAVKLFASAHRLQAPYDLIVLDIVMPEMDGNCAAAAIRALEKKLGISIDESVRIIVLSSQHTTADIMQTYITARSSAHLIKPVLPDRFISTLCKIGLYSPPTQTAVPTVGLV